MSATPIACHMTIIYCHICIYVYTNTVYLYEHCIKSFYSFLFGTYITQTIACSLFFFVHIYGNGIYWHESVSSSVVTGTNERFFFLSLFCILVCEYQMCRLLWSFSMQIDRTLTHTHTHMFIHLHTHTYAVYVQHGYMCTRWRLSTCRTCLSDFDHLNGTISNTLSFLPIKIELYLINMSLINFCVVTNCKRFVVADKRRSKKKSWTETLAPHK